MKSSRLASLLASITTTLLVAGTPLSTRVPSHTMADAPAAKHPRRQILVPYIEVPEAEPVTLPPVVILEEGLNPHGKFIVDAPEREVSAEMSGEGGEDGGEEGVCGGDSPAC
ncbi:hypothetical protein ACN47E_002653 [Coniothyrium glycines]